MTMSNLVQEVTAPNGVTYQQPLGLFINNQWVASSNGQKIASINPATESEIVSVHSATEDDIDTAVRAARAAFESEQWNGMEGTKRGQLMMKLADIVEEHATVLGTIECLDNGKPHSKALGGISEVYNVLRYYAGWADKNYGQTIDTSRANFTYTVREPIGVCAQIIPWNYPLGTAAWKLGPALACGNTVVIKPSEETPLSSLYFANLVVEAGFPPGVINIINGRGPEAGAALVQHPEVDKVSFTGSTATGKQVMNLASRTLKNITLETGGKSPLIIFEDAQLETAVHAAFVGAMGNMGQICTATSRIFVHERIYDAFMDAFVAHVTRVSVIGDPFDSSTSHGAQVSKQQFDKILSYVQAAKEEGATVISGGTVAENRPSNKGFFISPTVVGDVRPEMRVYREEIFGPFGVFVKFKDEEEVIKMANDTDYGLAAAICTRDNSRIHRVVPKLRAGMVSVNATNNSDFRVPFGGVKQSGIGRELGQAGLEAYCNIKAVLMNIT